MPRQLIFVATLVCLCLLHGACQNTGGPAHTHEHAETDDGETLPMCECEGTEDLDLVDIEEEGLPSLSDRQVRAGVRLPETDADTGLDVYFGNLHSHTGYSDGKGQPRDAFRHARDEGGLDFLALTEHNHRRAGRRDRSIAYNHDLYTGPRTDALIPTSDQMTETGVFVALYGQEFSSISSGNHVNVFDVPKVIDEDRVSNGDYDQLLDSWLPAHPDSLDEPALLQLNHPWSSNSKNSREYGRDDYDEFKEWRTKLDARAQLIEVINGPSHSSDVNRRPSTVNASEFRRYLGMGFRLAPTANQDNHYKTWGTITEARTGVITDELSKASVLSALKNRHVYASLDKNLRLIATVEGKLMGSVVTRPIDQGDPVGLEISIADDDEPMATYWVEVFADRIEGPDADSRAKLVATYGPLTTDATEPNVWELSELEYGGWDYLYLKVLRGPSSSPSKVAYLAPVWFASRTR